MTPVSQTLIHRVALATASVSGAFVVLVAALLVYYHVTATTNDPWKSPQLLALREQLHAAPGDNAVKEKIRALDLRFRQDYRKRLRLSASGGWLLLGGAVVLVISLQTAVEARRRLPLPQLDRDAAARAARQGTRARIAVAGMGGAALASMAALGLFVRSALDEQVPSSAATAPAVAEKLPSTEEFMRNWPRFRGPDGSGVAAVPEAPLRWDTATGAGIAWKTPVSAPGFNSPIVWNDRVFLSGATAVSREILCFDARDGRQVWQCRIETPRAGKVPNVNEMTGYAAPTMATDGLRVYAIFAHGDLSAVSFDGKLVWTKHLGVPDNFYGHATSLAVWEGRVIVQFDQGEGKGSKIITYDGATGRVIWEKPRHVGSSWATPIVVPAAGKTQIVTLAEPKVIAYNFADGAELWQAEVVHGEIVSSPILAAGSIVVMHPFTAIVAVKPDGSGDVAATHVAWKTEDNMPDVTTPASDGELIFTVESGGMLACYDAKTGKKAWEQDLKLQVQASPVIAGKRLYIPCVDGVTLVLEIAREYREVARNNLGEKIYATPALVGGRMYLRGVTHLFCLTGGEAKP